MNIYNSLTDFIFVEDEPQHADIIFVAGNTYPDSAEKAAELYINGYAKYIMPSGRYSIRDGFFVGCSDKKDKYTKNYKTEFEFMKDVLMINGVPEKSILKEDKAQYTYQNALFSKDQLDFMQMKIKKAIICCKTYHARRCLMYYQIVFPDVEFLVCPGEAFGIDRYNWLNDEAGINQVLGETQRIGEQFKTLINPLGSENK